MILVTGGTGFLGAHLISHLILEKKQKIRAVCRKDSSKDLTEKVFRFYGGEREIFESSVEWIEADLGNYAEVNDSLDGITEIYHAAAMVSYDPRDRVLLMENNVDATANIVNAVLERGSIRLCHVSSIAAMGETDGSVPIDEKTYAQPGEGDSGYSVSKYHSETEVWRGISEGMDAFIINPSVIIGYGDWSKGSCALFSRIAKGFTYYTNGYSGFVGAKDVCQVMTYLMDSGISGERYIVSAENICYRDMFGMIAESVGAVPPGRYATPFLTGMAWRMEYLRSKIAGKSPLITKESARTSHKKLVYSGEKLEKQLQFKFRPVREIVSELGVLFREEN